MAVAVTQYQGKSLHEWMDALKRELLTAAHPPTIENAMTVVGLTDPLVRRLVGTAFKRTLREGGENYETLTRPGRWSKTTEKWAPPNISKAIGPPVPFRPSTEATDRIKSKVNELNGQIAPEAQLAALNIADVLARSAGKTLGPEKLEEAAGEVSDLLANNAAIGRELEIHKEYQKDLRNAHDLIRRLVEERLEPSTGKNVR